MTFSRLDKRVQILYMKANQVYASNGYVEKKIKKEEKNSAQFEQIHALRY